MEELGPDELRTLNPKECKHAEPYMTDNGILDIFDCKKHGCNCYFEPNGGVAFEKICEKTEGFYTIYQ